MASRHSRGKSAQRRSRSTRPRQSSSSPEAFTLLKSDHREVDALLKQFERARRNAKSAIAERICTALTVHAQIEEEIFYPAAREVLRAADQDLIEEADVEHASLKNLIRQIQGRASSDDSYTAKVTVLGEYTKHHVKEEESELFPKLRKSRFDAKDVGQRLAARKGELMAQSGHPESSSARTDASGSAIPAC
jgi:hemerythrin superfamily protein